MKKLDMTDRCSRKYDLNRHLLRVTVMLNTISVLRKKKYNVDREEVKLKLQQLQTISYDHISKLFHGKTISETEFKTAYSLTSVIVSNEDCLVRYEKLVSEGYRPLLLNMANVTSPGGGYSKGDGPQEANIFRRSDYYPSLDLKIVDKDRSERLYCTPKYEIKRPPGTILSSIQWKNLELFTHLMNRFLFPRLNSSIIRLCYRSTSTNFGLTNRDRKRFYKKVSVVESSQIPTKYEILLDQHQLKTPLGNIITIENEFLALALAQEWNQQYKKIDLSSMHLYSLINTFIDNPLKFTKKSTYRKINVFS
ncbi:unnamed protein product [Rotaria sp. Silwood1]|nr:unnamed protein product [Rotaria sp. Silwood1]